MKQVNKPVRLYDAETLKFEGEYEKGRIGILGRNELVLDFRRFWPWCVILALLIAGMAIAGWKMADKCSAIEEENQQLKTYIEVAEYDLNVELLAGRYATSRTPVPEDHDKVYMMCIQSGAWYPEIIMAQFIIESASGTSSLSKKARNFYGMKYISPKGRPTLQIPEMNVNGYGMYLNWQHSILDRILWDDWTFSKKKPETREQYLKRIGAIYAEDPEYITKVTAVAKTWEAKTDSLRMVMEHDSITLIK